jgi:hypothetical protein
MLLGAVIHVMHVTLHMKIEQFSSLNVVGPPQYSKPQLFKAPLPDYLAQIAKGKKLVEPADVSIENISWIKNTLVLMMIKFGNVLSVISTYLKLHILD